jgi:hypothetical protein
MDFDVVDVLTEGFSNTFSKIGLSFAAIFLVVSSLYQSGLEGLLFSQASAPVTTIAVTYSMAVNIFLLGIGVIGYLLSFYLAVNHFYNAKNSINLSGLSGSLLPLLNLIVGSGLFALIVLAGTFAFLIPGIYLYVSLIFYSVIVVVEEENFIEALKGSWKITKGSKLKVFAVLASVLGISLIIGLFTTIATGAAEIMQVSTSIGFFLGLVIQAISSLIMTLLIATLTATYKGLKQA